MLCDRELEPNWYRFSGPAGENMPLYPPLSHRCGTNASGWLDGNLPKINYETVTRRVCFHLGDDNCKIETYVNVTNCVFFNVYYLPKPPVCSLRYCGDKPLERKCMFKNVYMPLFYVRI